MNTTTCKGCDYLLTGDDGPTCKYFDYRPVDPDRPLCWPPRVCGSCDHYDTPFCMCDRGSVVHRFDTCRDWTHRGMK